MTETLLAADRHHLNTQLVSHEVKWVDGRDRKTDGITFTVLIRTGLNWREYWIQSYSPQTMAEQPTELTLRMVELTNNVPTKVMIGGIWYEVGLK